MKATRVISSIAIAAISTLGLATLALPAEAATRTTVVVHESNALTGFNTGVNDFNLVTNTDVGYLTGAGFSYYNDKRNLIRNTTFGSYALTSKSGCGSAVKYTVKPGQVWSDGTKIDAVDLLLSHVVASSQFSKDAGLGDPSATSGNPAFQSSSYGGPYDSHIKGIPTLSSDKMSLTLCYDAFQPDWEIQGPGPAPVHTMVLLAEGKTTLGTAAENTAAKAKFLEYVTGKNTAKLTAIGNVWSNSYNITSVSSATNPLLFVGNGGYLVTAAATGQSVTLTKNAKYTSGPKLQGGIKTVIFKFISDSTAAAQALANKELDIYAGQPTADGVAALKAVSSVKVVGGVSACFEHLDLRVGASAASEVANDSYKGVFAGMGAKAKALRKAFLLAYPRQEILDSLVKPVNSSAVVVNSSFLLPGQTGYEAAAKAAVDTFTKGTQETRAKAALAIIKKYYPAAKAGSNSFTVKMLWGAPSNARRANEFAIAQYQLAKVGINLTNASGTNGWSGYLDDSSYDAQFFAWCPSSTAITGTNANFQSDGGNNSLGYKSAAMDKILHKLETKLSSKEILAQYAAADKILVADALTLPIFQHPAVTAYNKALKNVKPAPLTPNYVWNYWEWKY